MNHRYLSELIERYPVLSVCEQDISAALEMIIRCYQSGGKIMTCGNGGSAADAMHIVGELAKSFVLDRKLTKVEYEYLKEISKDADYLYDNLEGSVPAISLVSENPLMTAYANDKDPDMVFAQQVYGLGCPGDLLFAISTSGDSKNVLWAAQVAGMKKVKVLALTGKGGGKLKSYADCLIDVPETETYKVQELHLPVYHALCLSIEDILFQGRQ